MACLTCLALSYLVYQKSPLVTFQGGGLCPPRFTRLNRRNRSANNDPFPDLLPLSKCLPIRCCSVAEAGVPSLAFRSPISSTSPWSWNLRALVSRRSNAFSLQSLLSFSCGIWAEQMNTLLLPAVPVTFTQICFSVSLSTSATNGASGLATRIATSPLLCQKCL